MFRSLFGRKKSKDWIEKVKVEELEKERLRIDNQIQLLSREIQKLEKQKKELFRQGIGKSEVEKMLLAEKIKDLDAEIKMKIKEYNTLMKQRRALSNLIRLKKWEGRLKEKGIWEKIKSIEPERLIKMLTEVEFQEEVFEKNIDKINEILGAQYAQVEMDETTREIMEMWEKVEKAELSPEAIEEKLEVKIAEKKEEEEEEEKELA
ncbi:MAG: hypothetical protein J7L82_06190 [Staphylothermus sp.]|nr:hypothetical protein [Staphylothermus sp.]